MRRLLMSGCPPIRLRRFALGQEFSGVEVLHFNPRSRRESRDLIRIELHRPSAERKRSKSYSEFTGERYKKDGFS
jgi:hypothetical protein